MTIIILASSRVQSQWLQGRDPRDFLSPVTLVAKSCQIFLCSLSQKKERDDVLEGKRHSTKMHTGETFAPAARERETEREREREREREETVQENRLKLN
jgi:hypothetical protein